jgi:hypothetical protein
MIQQQPMAWLNKVALCLPQTLIQTPQNENQFTYTFPLNSKQNISNQNINSQ